MWWVVEAMAALRSPVHERSRKAFNRVPGAGMNMLRLALCGHKTSTTGAKMRGSMVLLCVLVFCRLALLRAGKSRRLRVSLYVAS